MPEHIAVKRIQSWVVDVGSQHALAQIVEYDNSGGAAQTAEGLLMQLGPHLRTGTEHQQANRLAAVPECQHEQPRPAVLAALRVAVAEPLRVTGVGLFLDHKAGATHP